MALDLIADDIASTLGWTLADAGDFVIDTAAVILRFHRDPNWPFELRVLENAQQRMHDEFIDTTWPECPVHEVHPLWLTEKPPWRWRCGEVSTPLGGLRGTRRPDSSS